MKRFLFWMVLGIVAVSWMRAHAERQAEVRARQATEQMVRALEVYERLHGIPAESHGELAYQFPPPPANPPREAYGDIPVPIVPGTRVTEAKIGPPAPFRPSRRPPPPYVRPRPSPSPPSPPPPPPAEERTVTGRLSATPERAREDVRLMLEREVATWVEPEVPHSWKTPARLVDVLVLDTRVKTVQNDLGTVYEASVRANFAPPRRAEIVSAYHRELVARRLAVLVGVLGFVLTCLAALAGYIRADEATKGYYTNHLRLATAATVGAAGVVIYQLLT